MRRPRQFGLAICVALLSSGAAQAADLTAISCSRQHVQEAVNNAVNGDRVVLPPGSCAWEGPVKVSGKAITLTGSGTPPSGPGPVGRGAAPSGGTTISTNFSGNSVLSVGESTAGHVRLRNITFVQGHPYPTYIVDVGAVSGGRAVLASNLTFQFGNACVGNAFRFTTNRGVIWKSIFNGTDAVTACKGLNIISSLRHYALHPLFNPGSWTAQASTMGTADTTGENNLYFEDNTVNNQTNAAVDTSDFSRIVVRYNDFLNSGTNSHGPDTNNGTRHWEFYGNTFKLAYSTQFGPNLQAWISLRGGTGVIFNNTWDLLNPNGYGTRTEMYLTLFRIKNMAGPCWGGTYPMSRQLGRAFNGTTQITEPFHIWNNGARSDTRPWTRIVYEGAVACTSPPAPQNVLDYVVQNRDGVLNTAKPGYAPYIYPHPLVTGSDAH
jgi:hypothetical protein